MEVHLLPTKEGHWHECLPLRLLQRLPHRAPAPSECAMKDAMGVRLTLATMMALVEQFPHTELARSLPKSQPRAYRVHIPKAQRKGKTWAELQAMREERA